MTPGMLTARYAVLATEHGIQLDRILRLTPRNINDIYNHPRDKEGRVKAPETPVQTEGPGRINQLVALVEAGVFAATPEVLAKLKAMADGAAGSAEADN